MSQNEKDGCWNCNNTPCKESGLRNECDWQPIPQSEVKSDTEILPPPPFKCGVVVHDQKRDSLGKVWSDPAEAVWDTVGKEPEVKPEVCVWREVIGLFCVYQIPCIKDVRDIPVADTFVFCPFCGKKIEVKSE